MLVNDKCMLALQGRLEKLAEHLIAAAGKKRHFAIRYHNDCDGICAGLLVYKALRALDADASVVSIPSSSAVYTLEAALNDLSSLKDAQNSSLMILDHGANPESVSALRMLKAAGVELIVIDHHPHDREVEKIANYFISPLLAEGSSSHTVGLLCYELARMIDEESVDVNLAYYSLQADKSAFALKGRDFKESYAIDYIANFEELGLKFYEGAIYNKEIVQEAYQQAKEKIGNALKLADRFIEVKEYGGYNVVIVKVGKFLRKGDYPTRGKIMNEIIAKKEAELVGKPLACLGITDDSISFRANQMILQKGFDANKIIQQLKQIFAGEIISGGGHSGAASVQANADVIPAIMNEALELIQKQIVN